MKTRFSEFGIWVRVTLPSYVTLSEERKQLQQEDDAISVELIVRLMSRDLKRRFCIPRPITTPQLLHLLREFCKRFRFFDLPRELRDNVLGKLLVFENEICEAEGYHQLHRPSIVDALTAVSRQMREESFAIYYSRNQFSFAYSRFCTDLEDVQKWVDKAGLRNLQHLRSLSVRLQYAKRYWYDFDVKWTLESGLEVECVHCQDFDYDPYVTGEARQHRDYIEAKKQAEQWDSTGVIEYFVADMKALRKAFGDEDQWVQDDDTEHGNDERNAYEVAYGKGGGMVGYSAF